MRDLLITSNFSSVLDAAIRRGIPVIMIDKEQFETDYTFYIRNEYFVAPLFYDISYLNQSLLAGFLKQIDSCICIASRDNLRADVLSLFTVIRKDTKIEDINVQFVLDKALERRDYKRVPWVLCYPNLDVTELKLLLKSKL